MPSPRLAVSFVLVALSAAPVALSSGAVQARDPLAAAKTNGTRAADHDAWLTAAAPRRTTTAPVVIAAHDPGRGAPSLLWTPAAAPVPSWLPAEAAARLHLDRHRDVYGVSRSSLAGLQLRFVHDTGRGGIIVVLRQTVAGADVFHGDVKVLLARSNRLVGISGTPHPAAHAAGVRGHAGGDVAAIAVAMHDRRGVDLTSRLRPLPGTHAGWRHFDLQSGAELAAPARIKSVYFPAGDSLVPGRLVELQLRDAGEHSVVQYVIADDGRILHRRSATADDAFTYRVYADPDGEHRPTDGPLVDYTPNPEDKPGEGPQGFAEPVLVTTEGFHSLGDPWLPSGALETRGNNVDAYVDHVDPDGLVIADGEFRGLVTAPGVFDYSYDPTLEPLATQTQSMAAIVELFYLNNWLHDWWYDSGFTEAAGNAQADNYGRGGADDDAIRAEAQDGALIGKRNNANMSTPMDGASPRMQMYLWTGLHTTATIDLDPAGQQFSGGLAKFGPVTATADGPLVRVEDGAGTSPTDGCEPPTVDLTGAIALIDRGNCTYETKVTHAQAAGAVGVVVIDNVAADEAPRPGNDNALDDPTIPTMAVTMADGAAILDLLEGGAQQVHLDVWSSVERDGTVDNLIIAHEWGHYIHNRLVECGSSMCSAESEGWGDFNALMMALREGDDLGGAYASSTYANFDPAAYYGIRRVPYSINTRRNALSFRHIADFVELPTQHPIAGNSQPNSEVHNAGEVWASMMWEAYIALHQAHADDLEFAAVRRRMGDYVVGGMIMAPPSPTFTEQRDGILLAAAAADPDDFLTIAEAFARRGAGSCAVSPPKDSSDFLGVVEDFTVGASGLLLGAALEVQDSCDDDAVLDPGESGSLRIDVYNGGVAPLPAGAIVEVVDPDPALVFPDGPSRELPALGALELQTVTIAVGVADDVAARKPLSLQLRLHGASVCGDASERALLAEVAADVALASASVDDVDAEPTAWTLDGNAGELVWHRAEGTTDRYFWHAADVGYASDAMLVSPPLSVGDDPLTLSFDHAHKFEYDDMTFYDGAVLEVSSDDGESWVDISTYTDDPGYGPTLNAMTNPLNGRPAFAGQNASYPERDHVSIDLGTALAGQTIRLRFRVGTDGGVGAPGWDIDNIAFTGITNTPFPTWTDDPGCDGEPTPTTGDDSRGSSGESGDPSGEEATSDPVPTIDEGGGCGCTSTPATRWQAAPLLLLLALGRRRRR